MFGEYEWTRSEKSWSWTGDEDKKNGAMCISGRWAHSESTQHIKIVPLYQIWIFRSPSALNSSRTKAYQLRNDKQIDTR